ncbi:MAG: hypothetical protein C0596_17440 [Marinilabiliales bacterium]|nr:MAG: hypothetical protein C0596_17440 [Marinilabiliales bacterium]
MRIIIKSRYILLVFILLFILGVSCDEPINDIPIVTTYEADSISSNCVLLTGSVYEDTTILIIERGFCWSQSTNVSINDNKIDVSGSFGNFSYYLTNLNSNERYYSLAYAIGDNGTGYGELIEFTTPDHREKYTGTYYCTGEAHIWN